MYNPGEPVLGTTSALYALFLAAWGLIGGASGIVTAGKWTGIVAAGLSALLFYGVLRRTGLGNLGAALAMVPFLLHERIAATAVGGMETGLVLAWMSASLLLAIERRWLLCGATLGLLLVTRPDGLVWAAILLLLAGVPRPTSGLAPAITGLLSVVAPWVAYATVTFGSPIPHSILAKRTEWHGPERIAAAVGESRDGTVGYVNWFVGAVGIEPRGWVFSIELVEFSLWAILVLTGCALVLRASRERPPLLSLVLFPIAYAVVFALGKAPTAFPWYLTPFTAAFLVLGGLGLGWSAEQLIRLRGRLRWIALAVCLGIGGITVERLWEDREVSAVRHQLEQEYEETTRRAAGEWLRLHTPPDATVAMEAIGYQGWYSRRRVLDLAGLVSPEVVALRDISRTNGEAYARIFSELEPDYVVLRSREIDGNRHFRGGPTFDDDQQRAAFRERYREVARFEPPPGTTRRDLQAITIWGPARQDAAMGPPP